MPSEMSPAEEMIVRVGGLLGGASSIEDVAGMVQGDVDHVLLAEAELLVKRMLNEHPDDPAQVRILAVLAELERRLSR